MEFSENQPPRASIVLAAHNEGDLLARTVESCMRTAGDLDCEIVVADDASSDGCVDEVRRRWPEVRVVSHRRRRGCSPTKDLGARKARGDVLVFLDGHCNPEKWAIIRLVNDVEELDGKAIVTPRVLPLCLETWENSRESAGYGFRLRLDDATGCWVARKKLKQRGQYYETPALVGCCLAISRKLYKTLRGFDRHMLEWGVEDVDLSLKAWLMGYAVLNNPHAIIGHRFQCGFDNFPVADESVYVNQLRMARKNFTEPVWREWLRKFRSRHPGKVYRDVLALFQRNQASVEQERKYLLEHRLHDEFWYARRFRLRWPARPKAQHPAGSAKTSPSSRSKSQPRCKK